jgi:hypothetical protein
VHMWDIKTDDATKKKKSSIIVMLYIGLDWYIFNNSRIMNVWDITAYKGFYP